MKKIKKIIWISLTSIAGIIGLLLIILVIRQWPRLEERMFLAKGKVVKEYSHLKDVERIEKLAADIKGWDSMEINEDSVYFNVPRRDIVLSILKHPQDVTFEVGECPDCGNGMVSLRFVSPDWKWQHLCGEAGPMQICTHCRKLKYYRVTMLN